jgi:thymidine kinase
MQLQPVDCGWIEVICGSMFSGKTEELIRRLKRALIAQQHVQAFKPLIDDRYHAQAIASHAGRTLQALAVADCDALAAAIRDETRVIGIDEVQFFSDDIVQLCQTLALRGVRVIAAGLDQDYLGRPFGPMPALMVDAEFVTKALAICVLCGNPAHRSHRNENADSGKTIQVGTASEYVALCRRCHAVARAEANAIAAQAQLDFADPADPSEHE